MKKLLSLLAFAVLTTVTPSALSGQSSTLVADVRALPQRFINREVTLVGQATDVTVSRSGLSQGFYKLIDDSDPSGIIIRTNAELPVPGRIYTVQGVVAQFPENAAMPGVIERSRTESRPSWLLAVIIGAGASALVLIALLIKSIRTSATAAAPVKSVPAATAQREPTQFNAPAPVRTEPFTPPPGPVRTEAFIPTGASVEVAEGESQARQIPLGVAEFTIGRAGGARKNHLDLQNPTVSQHHATIKMDEQTGRFFLVNASKTNKARLGGEPIEMAPLTHGDRIGLGSVTLVFHNQTQNGSRN
jgi:hypothetical protein